MVTSKRAERQWDRANASYENYLACIPRHRGRYRLTLSDLLHVRNFKGGNASVHVPQRELSRKLECWSGHLRKLAQLCFVRFRSYDGPGASHGYERGHGDT
jgi:hypothetical protein